MTYKPLTPLSPMPYGTFKGMQMQDVPTKYLEDISSKSWSEEKYPDIIEYVKKYQSKILISDAMKLRGFINKKNPTKDINPKV
jgi:uncharacterized protein (DUF3820 family)